MKVLIIDDDASNCRLLEILVRAEGHMPLVARDGENGIELAIAEQPNIVLLDLMMPGLDGFEVIRCLKNHAQTTSIPIVVVTALYDVAARQRIASCGADGILVKPIDRWELSKRLAEFLQAPKA
ncbi:response regulator [Rhodoferax sp. GW822-FHT02A01]|uniref:response regulator n=1 Tax=Rhodoferax sp. GW822-FHT02A01 TaxID=3141537 RepID=UPI00315C6A2F